MRAKGLCQAAVTRKMKPLGPGRVAQLVAAVSQYAKVAGWIPSQGTYI